jgi:hypothetical protein
MIATVRYDPAALDLADFPENYAWLEARYSP